MFLSDEGPTLETLDFAFRLSAVYQLFIFQIFISTLPTQHTTFIPIIMIPIKWPFLQAENNQEMHKFAKKCSFL